MSATTRSSAPGLDARLGERIAVGHDGFVMATDYMGSDESIVAAARLSYQKGTKPVSDSRTLLRYLMRHLHTSPSEHAVLQLYVRLPIYLARQWMRHRTGAFNEYSMRYSEAIDSADLTAENGFRVQSASNKQMSGGLVDSVMQDSLRRLERHSYEASEEAYTSLLDKGVAREQARKVLPLANYTEFVWKIDLHNLLHFLFLRLDSHAQPEIQAYGQAIADLVKAWVPETWQAFEDYRLNALTLTALDLRVLKPSVEGNFAGAMAAAEALGWLVRTDDGLAPNRERTEYEVKAARVGAVVPWTWPQWELEVGG